MVFCLILSDPVPVHTAGEVILGLQCALCLEISFLQITTIEVRHRAETGADKQADFDQALDYAAR